MKKGCFSLKNSKGAWLILGISVALVLIFSAIAGLFITQNNRVMVKKITLDTRGASLSIEQYEPRNVSSDDSLPCVILFHGGSESLSASSMVAWELAKRGFVVLNTSMYGCGLSEQPAVTEDGFREENYFRGGSQGMYDAVKYARNIAHVDNERIGVWAHSAGVLGCASALMLDGGYYTLNDRMLNILNSDYGVEITEAMISEDADTIAKAKLSSDDYNTYLYKKTLEEAKVDEYPNAARLSPSSGFNKKVKVAGIEVVREPQANAMTGSGTHEDNGYYYAGETDQYKNIFHTTDAVQRNGWYYVPDTSVDTNGKAEYLGPLFDTTVANSPKLKKAIEENRARLFFSPETIHNGVLWDSDAVSKTVEFYCQTMNYNNGAIGDPSATPIDARKCGSSYWALAFTTLATISAVVAIIALLAIVINTKFFSSAKYELYKPTLEIKSAGFWIAVAFAVIAAFVGTKVSSSGNLSFTISNATATKWLPWEPGQIRTLTMIIVTAVVGAALFLVLFFVTKKRGGTLAKFSDVHLGCGVKNVFKSLLLGFIMFCGIYLLANIIHALFGTRFMSADGSFEVMSPIGFMRMLKYAVILLPFTLVISTLNNMWGLKNVKDGVDTAINVVATSLGSELVVIIALLLTFSSVNHGTVWDVHTILSVIVLAPIMSYIYRKSYKVTGNVWVGAVIVALLLGWRLASYVSHQFIYYGPDPIKAFWGIY